jgi:uncharacterized protein YkwD
MERNSIQLASPRARAGLAAVLFLAGCAGASAQRAGAGAATVAGGKFTPAGPPAANYGPDPQRTCPSTAISRNVASDTADEARRIQKPAPQADGRLCAVAASLLGWDEQQPVPEIVRAFVGFHHGVPTTTARVLLATLPGVENARELAARLDEVVMQYVRSAAGEVRYGIATAPGTSGGTKLSLVMQEPQLELLEPFPRKLDPKTDATLSGRLLGALDNAKVLVSDPRGKIEQPQSKPGKELRVPVSCGGRTGRMAVEIRAERQGQPEVVANFPVVCGTEPPTSVDVPAPGGDPAQKERAIFEQINAERTEAGIPALKWDAKAAQVARSVSDSEAKGGGGGTTLGELEGRLKAAGIVSPIVLANPAATRTAEEAQWRFSLSPVYRANYMSTDATNGGIGVAIGKDAQGGNVAFVTELFVRELGQVDVATVAPKLRETINKKRASAGMPAFKDDPILDKVAQEYAQALASSNGNITDAKHSQIVSPLYKTFRTVDFLSGAKADPMEFADEKTAITSKEKAMGIGVAQGNHPVLGKNATYVVLLVGTRK